MKTIVLLGASGCIGKLTLDVLRSHPTEFSLYGCSFGNRIETVESIINEFHPKFVCLKNEEDAKRIQSLFPNIFVFFGDEGLNQLVTIHSRKKITIVNALQGAIGFYPTYLSIQMKRDVCLANKETLVMAGSIIMSLAKKNHVSIYPIDSEHSALWQMIREEKKENIKKLVITASGGAFRDKTDLTQVTKEDALKHPNWVMGQKITIDSATLMNKGFEIIEAHHLFQIPYDNIVPILHYESCVHSFVECKDSTIKAILGAPDMRIPIQIALGYPKRLNYHVPFSYPNLTFQKMDYDRFPCLKLAIKAGKLGGNMGVILNASNEAAVHLFLQDKIPFLTIEKIVRYAMDHEEYRKTIRANQVMPLYRKIYRKIILFYGGEEI